MSRRHLHICQRYVHSLLSCFRNLLGRRQIVEWDEWEVEGGEVYVHSNEIFIFAEQENFFAKISLAWEDSAKAKAKEFWLETEPISDEHRTVSVGAWNLTMPKSREEAKKRCDFQGILNYPSGPEKKFAQYTDIPPVLEIVIRPQYAEGTALTFDSPEWTRPSVWTIDPKETQFGLIFMGRSNFATSARLRLHGNRPRMVPKHYVFD